MIALYCRKNHGIKGKLCPDCEALAVYGKERSDKCPFMETKAFWSNCKVHCYKPEMWEKIRTVHGVCGAEDAFGSPCNGCIGVGPGAVGSVAPLSNKDEGPLLRLA